MLLTGKVAVVTGGASGIGAAIVRRYVAEGARVAFGDVNTDAAFKLMHELVKDGGYSAISNELDVTNTQNIADFFALARVCYQHIDILVNCAGITADNRHERMTDDEWDRVMNVNAKGPFLVTRAAIPHLRANNGGAIINIASSSAYGNFGQANYSASKAGLIGMTKTDAIELARYNIRVNAVAPGFVATPMTAKIPEDVLKKITAKIPLGRMATPGEIADACTFLATNTYITGAVLDINGGLVM
jgi:3-oxoacyl-[acyl-carrier protein] reductase